MGSTSTVLDSLQITDAADRSKSIDDLGTKASAHLNRAHFAMVTADEPGAATAPAAPPSDRWYRLYDQIVARGISKSSYVTAAALLFNELADLDHRSERLPRCVGRSAIRELVRRELDAGRQFLVELLEFAGINVSDAERGDTPLQDDVNTPDIDGERGSGAAAYGVIDAGNVGRPSLEDLVGATVAGGAGTVDRLMAELYPMVLRYCRGRLGRGDTVIGSADDVAQEVCLSVISALPSYQLKGLSFRAFVYGIAAHKVTDAFRAIARNRSEPMSVLPDAPFVGDGPEQLLLAGELTERLDGVLHRLTPHEREVLILRIAVGLSAEETAIAVGATPGSVRVTQHRALSRLRGMVGDDNEDDDSGVPPEEAPAESSV